LFPCARQMFANHSQTDESFRALLLVGMREFWSFAVKVRPFAVQVWLEGVLKKPFFGCQRVTMDVLWEA